MEPCECHEVKRVVRIFGKDSDQCINFDKSSLLIGKKSTWECESNYQNLLWKLILRAGWDHMCKFQRTLVVKTENL